MTRYDPERLAEARQLIEAEQKGHTVVIVSGDREGDEATWGLILWHALENTVGPYKTWTLCHGNGRGVDRVAETVAASVGRGPNNIRRYDADWHRLGPRAGPVRNERMIREAKRASEQHAFPVTLIACHDDPKPGGGTYHAIETARRYDLDEILHYLSDGEFTWERRRWLTLTNTALRI